jgi:hypothetical protein
MVLSSLTAVELLGYAGAACVLCAFSVRRLPLLRTISIAGNLTFIGYAWLADVYPVLLMNAVLLALNTVRLAQLWHAQPGGATAARD